MTDTTRYNGWTNRATWLVNLWLTNDEGDYNWLREMALEAEDAEDMAVQVQRSLETVDPREDGPLWWQRWHTPASLWHDLDDTPLSAVNWTELAGHWYDDFNEEGS